MVYKMAMVGRCVEEQPSGGQGHDSHLFETEQDKRKKTLASTTANNNRSKSSSINNTNNMTAMSQQQQTIVDACKKKNGVALNLNSLPKNDEKSSVSSNSAAATSGSSTANGETATRNKKINSNNNPSNKKKVVGNNNIISSKNSRINGSNVNNNTESNNSCPVSGKGLLFVSQPSIPNLRSRKDKLSQQQPNNSIDTPASNCNAEQNHPQHHHQQPKRPVPPEASSSLRKRRSSRHEKAQQQQTATTTNSESINCCCQEKKTQVENHLENNNASPFISQPSNNKGSLEVSSPLPPICDGLSLPNERTKPTEVSTAVVTTAAAPSGPGRDQKNVPQLPVIPRPSTPTPPCSAASASSIVNCTLNSSISSKDSSSQNFDYNCNKETVTHCKWKNCDIKLDPDLLMAHIREKHVESQEGSEAYVCFWDGCKVYAKRSCSMSWLERHILSHSGDKPFKCIVDGCDMRFPSHHGLERHVNSHFNTQQPAAPKPPKLREDTPTKLWKKKKMKRKRPQLVRTGDFFDSGIMERLQQELVTLTRITQIDLEGSTDSITFHGTVIARRTEESGKVKALLHWTPENIFPDCWVPESQVQEMYKRVIPLTSLPQDTAATLHSSFYRRHRYRKHRRK